MSELIIIEKQTSRFGNRIPDDCPFKQEKWKEFKKKCQHRQFTTFGNYDCEFSENNIKYCPRSRYSLCKIFMNQS